MRYYELPLTGEYVIGTKDSMYGLIGTVIFVELGTFVGSVLSPPGYKFAVAIPFLQVYELPFEFSVATEKTAIGRIGPPLSVFVGSMDDTPVFHVAVPPTHALFNGGTTAYLEGSTLLGLPAAQAWHWVSSLDVIPVKDPNRWVRRLVATNLNSFVEIPSFQFLARIDPSFQVGTQLFIHFGKILDDRLTRFAFPVAEEFEDYVLLSIPFWLTEPHVFWEDTFPTGWVRRFKVSGLENIIGADQNEIYWHELAFGTVLSYCKIFHQPKFVPIEFVRSRLRNVMTEDGWVKCAGIVELGSVAPYWWPAIAFVIGSVWSCHELPLQFGGMTFEGIPQRLHIDRGILIPQGYVITLQAKHIALKAAVVGTGLVFQSCWAQATKIEWLPKVPDFIDNFCDILSEAVEATDSFLILYGPTDGPFIYVPEPLTIAHVKTFLVTDNMELSTLNESLGVAETRLIYNPIRVDEYGRNKFYSLFRRTLDGSELSVAATGWKPPYLPEPLPMISGIRFVNYQVPIYGNVYWDIPEAAWYYDGQVQFYEPPLPPSLPPTPSVDMPQDSLVDVESIGGLIYQEVWKSRPFNQGDTFVGTIILGGFWFFSNETVPWAFERLPVGSAYQLPILRDIDFRSVLPEVKITFEREAVQTELGDREIGYLRVSYKISPEFFKLFRSARVFNEGFADSVLPLSARLADASDHVLENGPYFLLPAQKPKWMLFKNYYMQGTVYRWALQLGIDWQNPVIVNPGDTFRYAVRDVWPNDMVNAIFRDVVARKLLFFPIFGYQLQYQYAFVPIPSSNIVTFGSRSDFYSHPNIVGCSQLGISVSGSYHPAPFPFRQLGQIADLGTVLQFASTYHLALWQQAEKLFLYQMEGTIVSLYGTMVALALRKEDPTYITPFLVELSEFDSELLQNALTGGPHLREPALFYVYEWNFDNPYNTDLPTFEPSTSYGFVRRIYYDHPALPTKDAFRTGTLFYSLANLGKFGSASWIVSDVALAFGTETWTRLRDEFGNLDLKKVLCRGSYVHPSPLIFGSCVRLIFPFTGIMERLPAGNIRRFNIEPFMHQFYSAVFAGTMTALDSEVVLLRKVITMGNNKVTLLPRFADMPAGRVFYFTQDGGNCPLWMGEPIIGVDGVPLDDGRIRVFVYSVRGVYSFYLSINGVYDWTFDAIPRWFQTLLRGEQ
ncbi:MAG: hypothetical protein QW763_03205 [Archaeoglobaceae archaeon]